MANRKEYEMLFKLNSQLGSSFSGSFQKAQKELAELQKQVEALNKSQTDIKAYQKQQESISKTEEKLRLLQQQYDNIQEEMQETGSYSSDLANKLLAKQQQIDRTNASLEQQNQKLEQMGKALEDAGIDTEHLTEESERLGQELEETRRQEEDFGDAGAMAFDMVASAISAAGIAEALEEILEYLVGCTEASMEFESAITGVAKTTDLTDEELAAMSGSIKELSTEIPATTEEIAAVAEAAGQLGIQKDALLDFTEVMTMLGTATNMTADEAATALARFANITGMATEDYGRLGSVIVDLGNNFATTESEITAMGTRLASAGRLAGLSEAEIMALAAAMSSVGIEAEAGGTAMTQTLNAIEKAVATGGDGLTEFARIAGMSSNEFAAAWENDAMSALTSFIRGLGELDEQGESTVLTLEGLGLTGIRQSNMLKSLGLAADQMSGAVETANTAWAENVALSNEASKRYATTESKLTMMKNAYNNVEIAIGDAYNPTLRKLYDIATKLLNALAELLSEHPALVRAVTAFLGVLGLATAGLAAYAAITKVVIPLMSLLTASIPGVNIIMGVAAGVAAITAAVVGFVSAANEGIPSVKELTTAAREMENTMEDAQATYEETTAATLAAASVADTYIDKLDEMGDYASLSEEEQKKYHNTLVLLTQVVPELADSINLETNAIDGGTAALRANTEAWKQNAIQQAYQEQLTTLYSSYAAVLIEAEENSIGLTKAEYAKEEAQRKEAETLARMEKLYAEAKAQADAYFEETGLWTDATAFLSQEYWTLQNSLNDIDDEYTVAEKTAKNYQKAMDDDAEAVAAAKAEIALAEEAVMNLTEAMDDGSVSAEEAAAGTAEMSTAINSAKEQIDALTEAYQEVYNAALESVQDQYELWDEVEAVVATSASTINGNLQDQITYWQEYNANLANLRERTGDIEGLSEIISSFADGSADSVNAVAGMAEANDEDLAAMVQNWKDLQAEQDKVADNIAELKTDFTGEMDKLGEELAADIEAMDLSAEATEAGRATLQGYVNAANDMLPQIQAAYQAVANAAVSALYGNTSSGGGGSSSRYHRAVPYAYASGTQSAERGFALVGENGPEIVYFGGGEQVFTAEETAAMQHGFSGEMVAFAPALIQALAAHGSNAVYADMGGGGVSSPVSVVFQIEGNVSSETVDQLRAYGDEFVERVREVIEDVQAENGRRVYR